MKKNDRVKYPGFFVRKKRASSEGDSNILVGCRFIALSLVVAWYWFSITYFHINCAFVSSIGSYSCSTLSAVVI